MNKGHRDNWNAWRYPTPNEIELGRGEEDMIWIGSAPDQGAAIAFLKGTAGQIQLSTDGRVIYVVKSTML